MVLLGIHGNRLIDDVSVVKYFLPRSQEEEKGTDPAKIDKDRKRVINHIHNVLPNDMWGLQVVKYHHSFDNKSYFQVRTQSKCLEFW